MYFVCCLMQPFRIYVKEFLGINTCGREMQELGLDKTSWSVMWAPQRKATSWVLWSFTIASESSFIEQKWPDLTPTPPSDSGRGFPSEVVTWVGSFLKLRQSLRGFLTAEAGSCPSGPNWGWQLYAQTTDKYVCLIVFSVNKTEQKYFITFKII